MKWRLGEKKRVGANWGANKGVMVGKRESKKQRGRGNVGCEGHRREEEKKKRKHIHGLFVGRLPLLGDKDSQNKKGDKCRGKII